MLVKAGKFILKAESLDLVEQGMAALSAFHREMLGVSKIDKVALEVANLVDANPLSEIEVKVDHKLRGSGPEIEVDDKGALKLDEDIISQEIFKIFKNNVINHG